MIENELIQIWQSSPKHEQIKFEKSKLMIEVQSCLDDFDKGIKRRDWLEIGAAIITIPIFAFQAYKQPNTLAKVGAVWIVLYIFFVIYKLLKAKKSKPNTVDTYLAYLNQSKAYLQTQKSLLDGALYWYILPCLIGVFIMKIGVLDLFNKSWKEIIRIKMVWISLSVITVTGVFANQLNKWVVKKQITPRLKKVNELIRLLKTEE